MNTIETLENQIATREQINSSALLRAYINTQEAGNELLDFSEAIFDDDLPRLTEELDSIGVEEFTISVRQSDMQALLLALTSQGWDLVGLTQVLERFTGSAARLGDIRSG